MRKYFTAINQTGNMYTGTVYDANTNQAIYTTSPFLAQSQVVQDINNFLKTDKPTQEQTTVSQTQIPQTIQNTIKMQSTGPIRTGRCCGR